MEASQQQTLTELIAAEVAKGLAAAKAAEAEAAPAVDHSDTPGPKVDHIPQTPEEIQSLASEFAKYRAEVAAFREEMRQAMPRRSAPAEKETEEERIQKRLVAIAAASHYCPVCGTLGQYPQKCQGEANTFGHPAAEMVTTDELAGDPANFTKAPPASPDGVILVHA